mgnify:CR=1 FL=1
MTKKKKNTPKSLQIHIRQMKSRTASHVYRYCISLLYIVIFKATVKELDSTYSAMAQKLRNKALSQFKGIRHYVLFNMLFAHIINALQIQHRQDQNARYAQFVTQKYLSYWHQKLQMVHHGVQRLLLPHPELHVQSFQ